MLQYEQCKKEQRKAWSKSVKQDLKRKVSVLKMLIMKKIEINLESTNITVYFAVTSLSYFASQK